MRGRVVGRGESRGSEGGSEVGALLGVHGARKTKDGSRGRGKETVVKQAPGLGADERAAGEIGSELS
jgi:hypothetical protein